ncbi:uncharacterized protein LOC62_04G006222 [Vanrija pseudolonga]|uniref:Uncharacterized protein n=1 Tax=Vanrija pseudolonga TaxID=143232 RepID=A0AAF0YDY3_9TREE|nr:hypothetical protein LOC62_04G006222 [Vanrija pseudolonga]
MSRSTRTSTQPEPLQLLKIDGTLRNSNIPEDQFHASGHYNVDWDDDEASFILDMPLSDTEARKMIMASSKTTIHSLMVYSTSPSLDLVKMLLRPGGLSPTVDYLDIRAPIARQDVKVIIDFIKSSTSKVSELMINPKRFPPNSPQYLDYPHWYDLSEEDRVEIASALELHNCTLNKLELQGPEITEEELEEEENRFSNTLVTHNTRGWLYRNEMILQPCIRSAVCLALPVARILLRGRPKDNRPVLPREIMEHIIKFATQDECALTTAQFVTLFSHAASSERLIEHCSREFSFKSPDKDVWREYT